MPNGDSTGTTNWGLALILFSSLLAAGLLLRAIVFHALDRWAKKSKTRIDDFVLASSRWPSYLWILIASTIVALHSVHLPGGYDVTARRGLGALLALSITMGVGRFVSEAVSHYNNQFAPDMALRSTGLLRTTARVVTFLVGILIILSIFGINIAPLLGALGVGGLAAGLALQPMLTNLFAGFQIAVAKQIRVGHRVRMASGEEGYVSDISWRTTTLRTPNNHLVIIPNSKFADSVITNFNLPEPPVNVTVSVGVGYDSDLRRVEAALADEAQQIIRDAPLLVKDFKPVVRLVAFGESAVQFNVVVQAQDFESQFAVWNEIYTRIFERLQRESIEIPFPARSVYLRGPGPEIKARQP